MSKKEKKSLNPVASLSPPHTHLDHIFAAVGINSILFHEEMLKVNLVEERCYTHSKHC